MPTRLLSVHPLGGAVLLIWNSKGSLKKVAVVEEFYDIIYSVHVESGARSGLHAGQKRTYRAVTESYAFLPREAVTKFLLGCSECQKRVENDMSTPLSTKYKEYLPINLTTRNCVIRLSVPLTTDSVRDDRKLDWTTSTPAKRPRIDSTTSSSSSPEIDISPISTTSEDRRSTSEGPTDYSVKQEMRISPEPEAEDEFNGRNGDPKDEAEDIWNYNMAKKPSTPQPRDLSESGSVHDETSSSGNKEDDDDDDDNDDDLKAPHHDSERLKAFNMFVRLFVDENLDRSVPISKQPKEKIQAIIDSCTRQFPEYGERARKRIRTYLKSCRRNKRGRDAGGTWPEQGRPTPAHLTSVQAEQILAAACENESHNAKRMRLGLEPVSQPMPLISGAEARPSLVDHFSPANLSAEPKLVSHLNNNKPDSPNYAKPSECRTKTVNSTMSYFSSTMSSGSHNAMYRTNLSMFNPSQSPQTFGSPIFPVFPTTNILPNGATDLSMKSTASTTASKPPVLSHKLTPQELSAVKQLIAGYRESAAFLLRSADELETLLLQQP
ncbi:nucleolar protein 4-like isoform X3 [Rhodnius prolixus]|uniref:nucleolar protein 4-like isoform X3 n=1 Tax=Rhodnius prolixus TaxID=13249 RepID=UPI003D18B7A0